MSSTSTIRVTTLRKISAQTKVFEDLNWGTRMETPTRIIVNGCNKFRDGPEHCVHYIKLT